MTLLTVVVPVYKVQGYLRECLDSILDQGFDDLEVVAVDDCSPDGSGEILAEYAARDARVRVLSLPENVGLGPARNAGLDVATGEYVWFLDSDDWLAEGALRAVVRRLREASPDVLIFNLRRVFWDGSIRPAALPVDLVDVPGTFTAAERPEVLKIVHVAWNKVVRREFLVDLGLRFGAGWYEDVSFTFPAVVAAKRVSVLNRVCVNYRQRRVGAITRTVGDRHFEVFPHWERVWELLDKFGPEVDELRPAVFARMIWHYLIVMGNDNRVRRRSRREFFFRAADHHARYLPPGGYPLPGGSEGVKRKLLARRAWRTYSLLWAGVRAAKRARAAADEVVRSGRRAARKVVRSLRSAIGLTWYAIQRRLPVDQHLAVYTAYWNRGYSCNPAAIYECARDLAPDVRGVWLVRRDRRASVPPGVPYAVVGGLAYYRLLARAKYLVNNVNFANFVVKRRGSVHLQTHHGTPLKVMGIEQALYPGGERTDFAALLRRCDRWDFSVTSNALSTEAWERQYPCRYETLEYGYPRNDRLVRADDDQVDKARAAVGAEPGDLVVLYAPTHRSHHPSYRPPFEPDELADALGPRGRVLVRSHYFEKAPSDGSTRTRVHDVSGHASVEDLYLAADVLVTDYSSAMFDYANLDRPIVVYAPDWSAYRATRGVTFDLLAFPPGAVATTWDQLLEVFRTRTYAEESATAARAAFRARFCSWDDGHAAERVVRRVFLGEPVPSQRAVARPGQA